MPSAREPSEGVEGLQVPSFADREALARTLDRWQRWPPWRAWRGLGRPTADRVQALAEAVYSWPRASPFEFDVVGSFTELGSLAKDVDLIVRAKPAAMYDMAAVEDLMIGIEYFGLSTLRISVDTTFRSLSEADMAARARDGKPFASVKLYARRWKKLARVDPGAVRPLGRYLVEIRRPIEQTAYFSKLPFVESCGRRHRAYRAAVPLRDYTPS